MPSQMTSKATLEMCLGDSLNTTFCWKEVKPWDILIKLGCGEENTQLTWEFKDEAS